MSINPDPESQKINGSGRILVDTLLSTYLKDIKPHIFIVFILWYPRFADLHGCLELVSSTDSYIERHFTEVLECDEFYSLGADQAGFRLRNFFPLCVPVFAPVISRPPSGLEFRKGGLLLGWGLVRYLIFTPSVQKSRSGTHKSGRKSRIFHP